MMKEPATKTFLDFLWNSPL